MTADAPTRDEIRAAVAYGQMLAVRRILDELSKKRPRREGWRLVYEGDDTIPSAMAWQPNMHVLQEQGFDAALRVVKAYKVSEEDAT